MPLGLPTGASANPDGETNTAIANEPRWKMIHALNYHPGPMGLPEAATAAEIPPAMQAAWSGWFDLPFNPRFPQGPVQVGGGGFLQRTGANTSAYVREGLMIGNLTRTTNLNWVALQDPAIAAEWKRFFGFDPVAL